MTLIDKWATACVENVEFRKGYLKQLPADLEARPTHRVHASASSAIIRAVRT
ncbi:hypothetical protein [Kribbia dieselivorans]|uniref:hypothetical protein n=1 Tax=Kribbia dieselivorans TaxID=331526 RepID=UPI0012ED6D63|nr:hypothetical protein [Kribbia dieselivorans]